MMVLTRERRRDKLIISGWERVGIGDFDDGITLLLLLPELPGELRTKYKPN